MPRTRDLFSTVRSEGATLPPDLLVRIASGDGGLEGLNPEAYHLLKGEKLNEAINGSGNGMVGA